MLNLRNRIRIRIPDRLAVLAAVALTISAGGSMLGEQLLPDASLGNEATAQPSRVEMKSPAPDDTASAKSDGLASRLLLFRRG